MTIKLKFDQYLIYTKFDLKVCIPIIKIVNNCIIYNYCFSFVMHYLLTHQSPRVTFVLGEEIGSEPTLPYLSPELTGEKLLVGANFASAGVGILNDTGVQFVSFIHYFLNVFCKDECNLSILVVFIVNTTSTSICLKIINHT